MDIADGRPRGVYFRNNLLGQAIRRNEVDNQTSQGDPYELWYRFGGRELGMAGNNGTMDVDYFKSIADRRAGQGVYAFRNGSSTPTQVGDFNQGVEHINSYYQGSTANFYTVQSGDTLTSIAGQLWGDSSLWWKLAQANGLEGDATLIEGQQLVIPAGVIRATYNASTFTPYDPADVLGNLSPTAPKPPPQAKRAPCGGMGMVLLAVIAIAVTAIVAPYATAAIMNATAAAGTATVTASAVAAGTVAVSTTAGIVGGAIAGAAGSIVSQGIGVATRIQDDFSWNAVAMAAIGGGIGGGLGTTGMNAIARSVITNAATQGIGVATGLQKDFSWASVAAAAITPFAGRLSGNPLLSSTASLIAEATTRSLIDGTDFGDAVMAALPSAIGQTIGEMVAGAVSYRRGGARDYASTLRDRFDWSMDTQLPAGEVPGSYILAGDTVAGSRRSWLDWLSDFTGFGDGQFGNQNVPSDRLEGDWSNLRAAFRNLGRDSEEIVVEGRRITRDAGRIIRETPVTFTRGVNDSIQDNVPQPIVLGSRWITHTARDPVYGARSLGNGFQQLDAAIARAARTDLVDATQNFVGGRLSHYGAEFGRDGAPGIANALAYDAGYTTPLLAGGPYSMEARVGLSAEEVMLLSLRPNRVADDLLPPGSFSISDWWRYPDGIARPPGPFVLLEGAEYDAARLAANRANRSMHAADPALGGLQIHEIHPVKFGGSPTDAVNKIPLTPTEHSELTTWWRGLQRHVEERQR